MFIKVTIKDYIKNQMDEEYKHFHTKWHGLAARKNSLLFELQIKVINYFFFQFTNRIELFWMSLSYQTLKTYVNRPGFVKKYRQIVIFSIYTYLQNKLNYQIKKYLSN